MTTEALCGALRVLDLLPNPPEHKSAQSVSGGLLSLVAVVSMVFFLVFASVSREERTFSTFREVATDGLVVGVEVKNFNLFPANISLEFSSPSPCRQRIGNSFFAEALNWTRERPAILNPNETLWVPLCQDRTSKQGERSLNAYYEGIHIWAVVNVNQPAWIGVLGTRGVDGMACNLQGLTTNFLSRTRAIDIRGKITDQALSLRSEPGVQGDGSRCGPGVLFLPLTCFASVITLENRLFDIVEELVPGSIVDFVFDLIYVVTLIASAAGLAKTAFRSSKKLYRQHFGPQAPLNTPSA